MGYDDKPVEGDVETFEVVAVDEACEGSGGFGEEVAGEEGVE